MTKDVIPRALYSVKAVLTNSARGLCNSTGSSKPARKKVAIVGGGLAGLATCFHLLQRSRGTQQLFDITILDEEEVGRGGASGAMAGALHNLTPRGGKKIWMGDEGLQATLRQIAAASVHSNAGLRWGNSVVHLARTTEQEHDLQEAANRLPDETELVRLPGDGDLAGIPGSGQSIRVGLRIKGGCAVRGSEYTQGLLEACKQLGDVKWQRMRVGSIASVVDMGFDVVVIAAGAACCKIEELKDTVPLKCVRGQNIEYVPREGCGEDAGMLGVPIISGKYLVPFEGPDGPILCGGSTQEEDGDLNRGPDLARAVAELHEPLSALFKPLQQGMWIPSKAKAGVKALVSRGSNPFVGRLRLPFCDMHSSSCSAWLFTGLGSRGLIHHAVLGELLARAIISNDENVLPLITRRIPILGGEPKKK